MLLLLHVVNNIIHIYQYYCIKKWPVDDVRWQLKKDQSLYTSEHFISAFCPKL